MTLRGITFRTRLLVLSSATVVIVVGLVAWTVSTITYESFEQFERQRTQALEAQFRHEFARRADGVARRVQGIAESEAMLRIAIAVNRPDPDYAAWVNEARNLAPAHSLDFLELVSDEGDIISSAQWPARFGYKEEWLLARQDWGAGRAFLKREELPEETALALVAVRPVAVGDRKLFVVGGERLDNNFVASLTVPAGMRALLYRNLASSFSPALLVDSSGPVAGAERFAPLVEQVRRLRREVLQTVPAAGGNAEDEVYRAMPLEGRDRDVLGVLMIGSSRQALTTLIRRIRTTAFGLSGAGVFLGVLLSWWATARVTRPVRRLAEGAREVAAGNWNTHVEVPSRDEIGQLAAAFNKMTGQLMEQRERLVQAERVAAWRELARRLAHELKNPLFPMQITVENLQRAREAYPEQFDEVFRESTTTLIAELANLRAIVGRFSDFAKMPPPELQDIDLNALVRDALKLFEAQLRTPGGPEVKLQLELDKSLGRILADPNQIDRCIKNLVLNAMDAMPAGGTLRIRTKRHQDAVRLEVSDTGEGLTREECERLFTPYYTTKHHGTGLGLAVVQSVVSDHNGRIWVESERGQGATFHIELPQKVGPLIH